MARLYSYPNPKSRNVASFTYFFSSFICLCCNGSAGGNLCSGSRR